MIEMAEKRAKKQAITTMKAHEQFHKVLAELAKLKGTSVPVELDRHLEAYEEDLLAELTRRKEAIEQSRRRPTP